MHADILLFARRGTRLRIGSYGALCADPVLVNVEARVQLGE